MSLVTTVSDAMSAVRAVSVMFLIRSNRAASAFASRLAPGTLLKEKVRHGS